MKTHLIYYCNFFKWFILGGIRPNYPIKKTQIKKNKVLYANWSKAEYQRRFSNAVSNFGMLPEARNWWNEQPLEYRKKKKEKWKKRYGKDWRKHVLL